MLSPLFLVYQIFDFSTTFPPKFRIVESYSYTIDFFSTNDCFLFLRVLYFFRHWKQSVSLADWSYYETYYKRLGNFPFPIDACILFARLWYTLLRFAKRLCPRWIYGSQRLNRICNGVFFGLFLLYHQRADCRLRFPMSKQGACI